MNHLPTFNDAMQGSSGYQLWESSLAEQCGAFHPEPPISQGIESFQGAICPAHAAAGARIATNSSHIHRNVKDIKRDGHDFFYLVHQVSGSAVMDHCGMQSVLAPGDLVLLDSARPSDFYFSGLSEQISLLIPRHKLEDGRQEARLLLNQKIAASTRIAAVAGFITQQFFDREEPGQDLDAVMQALLSVIRPSLSRQPKDTAQTYHENVQRAVFEKARRCIDDRLADFELTPDMIASELGTSKRTLHRLFAQHGLSIGKYILERRLDRCAAAFEREADMQKISAVAFAWGFNDVSHFSRAFKARFGVSPKGFRSQHAGPHH